jgi:hypothetical protein
MDGVVSYIVALGGAGSGEAAQGLQRFSCEFVDLG